MRLIVWMVDLIAVLVGEAIEAACELLDADD